MEYKDYYEILGVPKNADQKQIKSAYRSLARQHHPDKNRDDLGAEEKLKAINEAYEVLGSPENRARYDRLGRNYHRYQQMGGNPSEFDFSQWFRPGGSGGGAHVDLGDLFGGRSGTGFSDFFETIFGSGGARRATGRQENMFGRQSQSRSRDIERAVEVSLEEAYHGTTRAIGQNGERFMAKIPAGAKTGMKIRLRGKGKSGPSGSGDLFLVVQVKAHPTFTREDHNLRVNVAVDAPTAVLGGSVTVPTLAGPVSLTIPAGTQGGQTFRLAGKGMPRLRSKEPPGDLLASVQIRIPKQLGSEERALYEQLSRIAKSKSA
jgi:curved DNA-binding protein